MHGKTNVCVVYELRVEFSSEFWSYIRVLEGRGAVVAPLSAQRRSQGMGDGQSARRSERSEQSEQSEQSERRAQRSLQAAVYDHVLFPLAP